MNNCRLAFFALSVVLCGPRLAALGKPCASASAVGSQTAAVEKFA